MSEQENREKSLTKDYLHFKSVGFDDVKCLSEFRPDYSQAGVAGPDIKTKCAFPDRELFIGIEITEYQVDRSQSGSPARHLWNIGNQICRVVKDHHCAHHPEIGHFSVMVDFNKMNPPKRSEIDELACQLVQFVCSKADDIGSGQVFMRIKGYCQPGDFEQFAILKKRVELISIRRKCQAVPCDFYPSDAAHIGIEAGKIITIIQEKASKRENYDLTDTDECWLLICATGETASDAAPDKWHCEAKLTDAALCKTAKESGFDRVIFWERMRRWDFEIPQHAAM